MEVGLGLGVGAGMAVAVALEVEVGLFPHLPDEYAILLPVPCAVIEMPARSSRRAPSGASATSPYTVRSSAMAKSSEAARTYMTYHCAEKQTDLPAVLGTGAGFVHEQSS